MSSELDPKLAARNLSVSYDRKTVLDGINLEFAPGTFTVILGPNACGKSTALRSLARVLKPQGGDVLLNGRRLERYGSRELARQLGLLPQDAIAPEGMRVIDLISRGRHPHHTPLRRWSVEDDEATHRAMAATNTTDLAQRYVDQLSGGQRQRVWVALLLAQETPVLLLDEPTTFLDVKYQYELLDLLRDLHAKGKTVLVVLHDINQAARYATDLIFMKEGKVLAAGNPQDLLTPELVREVYGIDSVVIPDPITGTPMVVCRT